jgi:hypothetical protein
MTAEPPQSFFPDLEREEQREADEWLHDYLRLVLTIQQEHTEKHADERRDDYPQVAG